MTAHLKPYPAYRDSGVDWIGRIPENWCTAALRHRYEQCLGKMLDTKRITGHHLVPYLRNVDVQWDAIQTEDLPEMDFRPDEILRFGLRAGDLLVCEGGEIGRCAIWHGVIEPCGFQKALHRLRPLEPERDQPRFLFYCLLVAATSGAFTDGHESTISHLTGEKLRAHRFPFPPRMEQGAISRHLDEETDRIRRYVRAKERLIELLEEYKQALIHQAVTGQVDVRTGRPYSAYKDSGMDWLGKIPSHWPMARVGVMFRQRKEPGPVGLPILEVSLNTGVRPREFSPSARKQVMRDRSGYQRACEGDIAYNTMRMWQGAVGIVPSDGLISPAYVVATPSPGVSAEFFCALLRTRSYRHGIDMRSRGIVKDRNRLYWEDFRQLPVPLPCAEEQRAIAAWLVEAGTGWRRGAECVRSQIALAEEFRTRLISDVVTGKLDVGGVAPLAESGVGIEAMVREGRG